jgi:hypothetical protein
MFGGETTDECLMLGGCTFNSDTNECISAKPEIRSTVRVCNDDKNDEDAKSIYKECMDAIDVLFGNTRECDIYTEGKIGCMNEGRDAEGLEVWKNSVQQMPETKKGCAELYYYSPDCDEDSDGKFFLASQSDEDGIGPPTYFCVDKYGHELPDSRKMDPHDTWAVDCEKYRAVNKAFQCPNAITLTTSGGVVIVNADNDAEDCSVTCNTDADCRGEDWCCYNGCGYKCKLPIQPLSGCMGVPGDEFQQVISAGEWDGCPPGLGGDDCSSIVEESHGAQIRLECKDGFDVIPFETSVQDIELRCHHGHWQTMDGGLDFVESLVCDKACDPYVINGESTIDGINLRSWDFEVAGNGGHRHGDSLTLSCPPEYGVVAGSDDARRYSVEEMTCEEGTWKNAAGGPQTIECSVCYDKYEFEWRDDRDNACLYYATRPMECNDETLMEDGSGKTRGEDARENCRVSCRSCKAAEDEYKNHNTRKSLTHRLWMKKTWKRIRVHVPVEYTRTITHQVETSVIVQLPMNEVCTDGSGSNIRKPEDGCPPGYTAM